jgi:hypothetical protein
MITQTMEDENTRNDSDYTKAVFDAAWAYYHHCFVLGKDFAPAIFQPVQKTATHAR